MFNYQVICLLSVLNDRTQKSNLFVKSLKLFKQCPLWILCLTDWVDYPPSWVIMMLRPWATSWPAGGTYRMKNFRTSLRKPGSLSPSFWLRRRGNPSLFQALEEGEIIGKLVPPQFKWDNPQIPLMTSPMPVQSCKWKEFDALNLVLLRSGTGLVLRLERGYKNFPPSAFCNMALAIRGSC